MLHTLRWTHPRGEVQEILCDRHMNLVMDALGVLGIGCSGAPRRMPAICHRCLAEDSGRQPSQFLIFQVTG